MSIRDPLFSFLSSSFLFPFFFDLDFLLLFCFFRCAFRCARVGVDVHSTACSILQAQLADWSEISSVFGHNRMRVRALDSVDKPLHWTALYCYCTAPHRTAIQGAGVQATRSDDHRPHCSCCLVFVFANVRLLSIQACQTGTVHDPQLSLLSNSNETSVWCVAFVWIW